MKYFTGKNDDDDDDNNTGLLWLQKRLATGNTLPTFPKTIYSSALDPADGHRTKIDEQCDRPASVPACRAAVVGLG